MENSVIKMKEIALHKNGKQLLDVPHLEIKRGEALGIIGPNGAGKSTLLKVMALLQSPDQGTIYLNQAKVWPGNVSMKARRRTAVVFQEPLMLDTTVFKNVATPLKLRNINRSEVRRKVNAWLEKFEITHLANRHARTLSGGEQQRVSLARAFVTNPEVLFLDEPFTALDLPTRKKLLHDFKQILKETNTTTLFVSHDYQEIKYLCESMFVVYNGEVLHKSHVNDVRLEGLPNELVAFLKNWMTPLAN